MSRYKKVLKWFVNILTTLLLLLLAIVVYGKASVVFKGRAYPNYFGYTFFSIASGSMEPTLYVNDVILVKIGNKDIEKDDIISYSKNKEIVTHRVISISNNTLTVKGDNNNVIDDPIDRSQVIGKVIKIYPKLSVWQKVITEPKILIAIFITFLLFDAAISYKGKDDKKTKKVKKEIVKEIEETIPKEEVKDNKKEEVKEEIKVEEMRANDIDEKKELILSKTTTLDINEIVKEKDDVEEDIDPLEYTFRLDLNEINKKIKSKVK